jgi:hypothetical protein
MQSGASLLVDHEGGVAWPPATEMLLESMNCIQRLEGLAQRKCVGVRERGVIDGFQDLFVSRELDQEAVYL